MDNRFLEMDEFLKQLDGTRRRRAHGGGGNGHRTAAPPGPGTAAPLSFDWAQPFSAQDRVLVVLLDNGGVDLGIPELADRLLSLLPGSSLIPDSIRQRLIDELRSAIRDFTDSLLEGAELTLNRYSAARPDLFGDVRVLRDGTASYLQLKQTLIDLSRAGKIVDLFILTHGSDDFISTTGGIDGAKIRAMRTEHGRPLSIRSVYMMNCVGSSLNQAWLDAGAKASCGSRRNNYLPEPTMYFFWQNWKDGQAFENAVTAAYRRTVNLMNDSVKGIIRALPVPGTGLLADQIDFSSLEFVADSAPVVQGQRTVTINSDDLTFTQSVSSSLATTVLPVSLLRALARAQDGGTPRPTLSLSTAGVDFIKQWEGFRANMYNDPVGHCTVGYGTLLHSGNCDGRPSEQPYVNGVTEQQATELLAREARVFEQLINETVTVALNQNQFDALVSFVYNIGGGAFRRSTLLRRLNEGDYAAVPTEMRKWTKGRVNGQLVDLPGLVRRRAGEADLFARPVPATSQSLSRAASGRWSRAQTAIDYTIPGTLPVIAQPSPLSCWAAVMTMMYSWKHNQSFSIADALGRIGQRYADMFNRGDGLDPQTAATLYADAGLVPLRSFNPAIEGWAGLLRKYGPLYVDVGYNDPNSGTHACIVRAIAGDGTPDNTTITYVDPAQGQTVTKPFREFLAQYEAQSAVEWPYTIVHWPAGAEPTTQQSFPVTHSFTYQSPSHVMSRPGTYARAQTPALLLGIPVADAIQIGLAGIAIVQSQVAASQGSFVLTYDKAQRMLTSEARTQMPGAQTTKQSYSRHVLNLGIGAINAAEADVIIEWEGNPYGEIGTAIIRRNLPTSTEWSRSSANITITKVDRIPLPGSDPRTWPIVYSYEGTYDPWGNGYFEFSGEFEINAFGGLKFNRHEVVSRSTADWAIGGSPEDKVQRGSDHVVPVPEVPQEQIEYLRRRLA